MDFRFDTQIVDISGALTALKHYRAGDFKAAIECLLKLVDAEPGNWDARLMLAASYYKTNQFAASERHFLLLYEKCPDMGIRNKAEVGLNASTAKLHNRETAEEMASAAAIVPPLVVPVLKPQSVGVIDTTQSTFLSWLDNRDDGKK